MEDFGNGGVAGARLEGTQVRDYFANYFMGAGSVPFQ
jgi:hypothetical protein